MRGGGNCRPPTTAAANADQVRRHVCCRLAASRARRNAPLPVFLRRELLVMHVAVTSELRRRSAQRAVTVLCAIGWTCSTSRLVPMSRSRDNWLVSCARSSPASCWWRAPKRIPDPSLRLTPGRRDLRQRPSRRHPPALLPTADHSDSRFVHRSSRGPRRGFDSLRCLGQRCLVDFE